MEEDLHAGQAQVREESQGMITGFAVIMGVFAGLAAMMAILIIREEARFRKKRDAAVKAGRK